MNKIYITNIPLSKIQSNIKNKEWQSFLHNEYKQAMFYSKENGVFIEEKGDIFYIEPSCEETYTHCDYLSHKLIIDSNKYIKIKVVSQLPVEYIIEKKYIKEYRLHNKSMITLIVSGGMDEGDNFVPLDFYFECKKNDFNMENIFFQKELNGFLLLLN